jgi:hypothetical protein
MNGRELMSHQDTPIALTPQAVQHIVRVRHAQD